MTDEQRRIPFGEERQREESPCPGCGVYYFEYHVPGCPIEECAECGGLRAECGCGNSTFSRPAFGGSAKSFAV